MVRAFFWFHPLIWFAHRQLIAAQEQACDQAALGHGIAPVEYAEDLLSSLDNSHLTPAEALSMARWSQLGNRVRHVLKKPEPNRRLTLIFVSSLTIAAILASTSIGFSQTSVKHTPVAPDPVAPVTTQPPSPASRGAILDRNGKAIAINDQNGKRTYPFGSSLGHLTGYLIEAPQKNTLKSRGNSGLETKLETTLTEKKDVKTTLNADVQQSCYELLSRQNFPGAIVVQNPNTGEIIAMVSYPSFDPNLFIPRISRENFDKLQHNENRPMINRSLGLELPGSIVKPIVALAGEYKGLNNPEIHCRSFVQFDRIKIRDWKSDRDELFRIPGALEQSCNTYFVRLGIRAGLDSMTEIGKLLHLNEPPLDLTFSKKGKWMIFPPDEEPDDVSIAVSSLGQGRNVMSPLHVSTITSAIATGSWHKPHLILDQRPSQDTTALIGKGNITAASLDTIRKGMNLTIHGDRGTSKLAAIPNVILAGKTGTAQVNAKKRNSWFTGFGPYESPKYSVTVFLEGAESGGKFATPIAAQIFEILFQEKDGPRK